MHGNHLLQDAPRPSSAFSPSYPTTPARHRPHSSSHPYTNRRAILMGRRTPPLPPRALEPHVRAVNHTGGAMIRTFRLAIAVSCIAVACRESPEATAPTPPDRKSTRLNSSHLGISYAVFCLKKKNQT